MNGIHSFIQSICSFVLHISKKSYRNCAVIAVGICVVAVVAFSSKMFGGSGKNCGYGSEGLLIRTEQDDLDEDESSIENNVSDELQSVLESDDENLQADFNRNEVGKITSWSSIQQVMMSADITQETECLLPELPYIDLSENKSDEKEVETSDVLMHDEVTGDTQAFVDQENAQAMSFITTDGTKVTVTKRQPREVTEEEYNILLHIAAAEAGGCDIYGRILVVNVILNRVDTKGFPNTIEGVVFQKNQFSPATKGTIWNAKVTAKTKQAVDRALAGEDYSCGALFFAARKRLPEGAMSGFDNNLERLFEHDGHEFFKYPSK